MRADIAGGAHGHRHERDGCTCGALPTRLLRKEDVARILGVSRSTIDRWVRDDPSFPQPRKLGQSAARYISDEILAYIADLPRIEYPDHGFDPNAGAPDDAEGGDDG